MNSRTTPKISVIIPCFNQARYLPEAVRSIFRQTHANWECLIINDGSTDDTKEVALALVGEDARVRYVEQDNRGLSGARNRGITEAEGQYLQFLDSDDLIAPEKFELQLKALSATTGQSFAYCDYYLCHGDDVEVELTDHDRSPVLDTDSPLRDIALNWERRLSIPAHCFLFDARLFKQHDIRFDESLLNHEDWDCWMRIVAINPGIIYVDCKLATYRIRDDSMCRDSRKMRAGFMAAIRKQRKLLAHDETMKKLLTMKLRLTAWESHEYAPPLSRVYWKAYIALHGSAARIVPKSARLTLNRLRGRS